MSFLPKPARAALAIVVLFVVATAGVVVVSAGLVAHRTDWPFERQVADVAVALAAKVGSNGLTAPAADPRAAPRAAIAYAGMCAQCHGSRGDGMGMWGPTTYPPARPLNSGDSKERTDPELFWLIKNGISLTGMPGFGGQLPDRDIWGLVNYLRTMQQGNLALFTAAGASERPVAPAAGDAGAVGRGAGVYFAQSCAQCHGSVGNGPGDLNLTRGPGELDEAVRKGRPGMPSYGADQVTDSDLKDLTAFLHSLANPAQSRTPAGGGAGQQRGPGGGPGAGQPQPANPPAP